MHSVLAVAFLCWFAVYYMLSDTGCKSNTVPRSLFARSECTRKEGGWCWGWWVSRGNGSRPIVRRGMACRHFSPLISLFCFPSTKHTPQYHTVLFSLCLTFLFQCKGSSSCSSAVLERKQQKFQRGKFRFSFSFLSPLSPPPLFVVSSDGMVICGWSWWQPFQCWCKQQERERENKYFAYLVAQLVANFFFKCSFLSSFSFYARAQVCLVTPICLCCCLSCMKQTK